MSNQGPSLPSQPHPVNNHRKRTRNEDDDDLHILSVKKLKEATPSPGLICFFRESLSAMAEWVKQRGAAFKNNFYTLAGEEMTGAGNGNEDVMAAGGRSGAGSDRAFNRASNGHGSSGVGPPLPNFGRRPLHPGHGALASACRPQRESLFKSVPVLGFPNGRLQSSSIPKRTLPGASWGKKDCNLTVRNCIRLEEKERYRQLLQHYAPSATLGPTRQQQQQPSFLNSRPSRKLEVSVLGTEYPSMDLKTDTSCPRMSDAAVVVAPSVKSHRVRQPIGDLGFPLVSIVRHQQWKQRPAESKPPLLDDPSIILMSESLPSSPRRQTPPVLHTEEKQAAVEGGRPISKAAEWKRNVDFCVGDKFKSLNLCDDKDKERKRLIAEVEMDLQEYQRERIAKEKKATQRIQKTIRLCARERAILEEPEEFSEEDDNVVEDLEEEGEVLPELTEKMMNMVNRAFTPGPSSEVLVEGFRLQIKRCDIITLRGLSWLNDEVINFYMNLLMERGEAEGRPKVYAFNTFFYPKLTQDGYSAVRRWTRRVDLFAMDYILVPVHLGMHWCLAIISIKHKTIRYFDSMGGNNRTCLLALERYLKEESMDKRKRPLDMSGWTVECAKDIPQQMNGSDCGMFACKFADYVTREASITFSQQDMPYFRQRMVYEILTKKLLQ